MNPTKTQTEAAHTAGPWHVSNYGKIKVLCGPARGNKRCDAMRNEAEELLRPLGVVVDYPGLYPSFSVHGFAYHTTESAVSAALEGGK